LATTPTQDFLGKAVAWKKAFGLAKADELIKIVDDVLNDR
jgi:hypothetical protein